MSHKIQSPPPRRSKLVRALIGLGLLLVEVTYLAWALYVGAEVVRVQWLGGAGEVMPIRVAFALACLLRLVGDVLSRPVGSREWGRGL